MGSPRRTGATARPPIPTSPPSRRARGSWAVRSQRSRPTRTSCAAAAARSPPEAWRRSTASLTSTARGPTAGATWSRSRTLEGRRTRWATAEFRLRDPEHAQRIALEMSKPRARRRALPVRRLARVGQRPRRVPGDGPTLARLRVPRPVDPEVGVDHRVRGARGRRRPQAAEAGVAPHGDPPAVSPVEDRPAAVLSGVDHEGLASGAAGDLEAVLDVGTRPVVVGGVQHEPAHLFDPDGQ